MSKITVALALSAALGLGSALTVAPAFARQTYDYTTDYWPQMQAYIQAQQAQGQRLVAENPSNVATDAGRTGPAVRDDTGVVHYGTETATQSHGGAF